MKRIIAMIITTVMILGMEQLRYGFDVSAESSSSELGSVEFTGKYQYDKAEEVLALVNKERAKQNLSPLKMDKDLLDAAMLRSGEIAVCFSHDRPDGSSCFSACNKMMGENIAVCGSSAESAMNLWMNSQGHRDNILTGQFKSVGIGCFTQGGICFWVQCFGFNEADEGSKQANENVRLSVSMKKSYLKQENFEFRTIRYDFAVNKKVTMDPRVVNVGAPQFACELAPQSFQWKSSDPSVATVDSNGIVKGVSAGTVTITGILKSNPDVKLQYKGTIERKDNDNKTVKKKVRLARAKFKSVKRNKKGNIVVKIYLLKNAKKYQIQYASNRKFKKAKKIITKTNQITIKNVKKKKYYVRVRCISGNEKGDWSVVKKVK